MDDGLKNTFPPGPKGTWLKGNIDDFDKHRLDYFLKVHREYGDIASFRFGPKRIFQVSHPDLIEQVLLTDAKHYIKHFGARMYMPVLGMGLVTSEGSFWLRQRKLSQPAFLKARVHGYASMMVDATREMLNDWQPGQKRDVHYEFSQLTSRIALKTLFGLDDPGGREEFVDALREAFDLMSGNFRRLIRTPSWLPTPGNFRLKRAIRHIREVVDGFIEQGRKRTTPGKDLLSMLIVARDELGQGMTPTQLRDEAMTLYLAGHETTALTLSWTWHLLARHPEVQDKLLAEWDQHLQGRDPTVSDLPKLKYTDAVLTESMRLLPPVYLIGREATKEMELGGYKVPKGTTIFMSQWVSHRDPRYFDDPETFRPERWLDGLIERIPKYAYYPFGGGPRVCIGNTFALMEAGLILPMVGQRFRCTLDVEGPPEFNPQITLLPKDGVHATLRASS